MKKWLLASGGLAIWILAGTLLGVGSYTFHYGEGWSYFSRQPETCINCHIMQPHYDTWLKSSHHAVAVCADCHLPQSFPHDYISKADNGWHHSWAFTFQDFHEPIQIKPRNVRILENNCRECHAGVVHQMLAQQPTAGQDTLSCLHCHSDVGHTSLPRGG